MFHTYQDLVSEEETKKIALLKMNTPLLYAIKYCFISSMFFNVFTNLCRKDRET